jgi:hypothetical protein
MVRVLRLVDIGGGRGDLALAIGACLADSLGGLEVQVQVLVLDINPRSLEQVRFELTGKKEFENTDVLAGEIWGDVSEQKAGAGAAPRGGCRVAVPAGG